MKLKINKSALIITLVLSLPLYVYVSKNTSEFPPPPGDSVRSVEPADSETQERRAYFTNFTREEVLNHYKNNFKAEIVLQLNYPPEDAQWLIRDQTRSTFLEELVHPGRESLYINGFEPKNAKDEIWYKGQNFRQKITIKRVTSSISERLLVVTLITFVIYLLLNEITKLFKNNFK